MNRKLSIELVLYEEHKGQAMEVVKTIVESSDMVNLILFRGAKTGVEYVEADVVDDELESVADVPVAIERLRANLLTSAAVDELTSAAAQFMFLAQDALNQALRFATLATMAEQSERAGER